MLVSHTPSSGDDCSVIGVARLSPVGQTAHMDAACEQSRHVKQWFMPSCRGNDDQIAAETLIALVNMTPIKARHGPSKQRAGKGNTVKQRKTATVLLHQKAAKR